MKKETSSGVRKTVREDCVGTVQRQWDLGRGDRKAPQRQLPYQTQSPSPYHFAPDGSHVIYNPAQEKEKQVLTPIRFCDRTSYSLAGNTGSGCDWFFQKPSRFSIYHQCLIGHLSRDHNLSPRPQPCLGPLLLRHLNLETKIFPPYFIPQPLPSGFCIKTSPLYFLLCISCLQLSRYGLLYNTDF